MKTQKIGIAASGGIDSLIATCLLQRQGHALKAFHFTTGFELGWEENLPKIKALYANLNIELEVLDLSQPFKNTVVDYFTAAYRNGLTPNPCMVCNPAIKFGLLMQHVLGQGFDAIATGHYARVEEAPGHFSLLKGLDPTKDQSYFLAMLNQFQLSKTILPLGGMLKKDVKAMAKVFGVAPLEKDESQDICFITGDYTNFLINRMNFSATDKGPVVNTHGQVIGAHNGLYYFTIGQRKGINIPAVKPYYVLDINTDTNTLTVGYEEEMGHTCFTASNLNWIEAKPCEPFDAKIKIRYRSQEAPCTITPLPNDTISVTLKEPQNAVTPGQGAVVLDGDKIICAGFIEKTPKSKG